LDTQEGMTSEDIKYVINMVLSSLDLKSLSEEDKEDIMGKFDEESEDLGGDDMGGLDMTDDTEVEDIQAKMDVPVEGYEMEEGGYGNGAIIDSIFGESTVDKVISKYFEISKKEILESKEKHSQKKRSVISQSKKQMEEVIRLSETIEQELTAKKFLNENSNAKIVGLTNKKNLVFENKGNQVKISPEGLLINEQSSQPINLYDDMAEKKLIDAVGIDGSGKKVGANQTIEFPANIIGKNINGTLRLQCDGSFPKFYFHKGNKVVINGFNKKMSSKFCKTFFTIA
jgi:hypothetical protein